MSPVTIHHHLHRRKRESGAGEPYPSPRRLVRVFDRLILYASIIAPFTTLPQLQEIYIKRNAAGVSLATWMAYSFFQLVFLSYGIIHREKVIIAGSVTWIVVDLAVVVGVLLYG